jgi:hypothetical protein
MTIARMKRTTRMDTATVEAFIDRYRATFESFDVAAIAGCFAFPCHVTSEGEAAGVTSVPAVDAWLPQVARIVGAYRLLGVHHAEILDLRIVPVTARAAHAVVRWGLRGVDGATVYDFAASYTVADLGDGLRITAIVHDETPKLLAAVAQAQAG